MANSPFTNIHATSPLMECVFLCNRYEIRGLLEKYPTFGREKETGLLGALDN